MSWKFDNFWACAVLRRETGAARSGPVRPGPARCGPIHSSDSQGDLSGDALGASGARVYELCTVLTPIGRNFSSQVLSISVPCPSKVMVLLQRGAKIATSALLTLAAS